MRISLTAPPTFGLSAKLSPIFRCEKTLGVIASVTAATWLKPMGVGSQLSNR